MTDYGSRGVWPAPGGFPGGGPAIVRAVLADRAEVQDDYLVGAGAWAVVGA